MQKLFSCNRGTHVIPLLQNGAPVTGQDSCYASAVIDNTTKHAIIKLVNCSGKRLKRRLNVLKVAKKHGIASVTILHGGNDLLEKPLSKQEAVNTIESKLLYKRKLIPITLPPYSFSVVKLKL